MVRHIGAGPDARQNTGEAACGGAFEVDHTTANAAKLGVFPARQPASFREDRRPLPHGWAAAQRAEFWGSKRSNGLGTANAQTDCTPQPRSAALPGLLMSHRPSGICLPPAPASPAPGRSTVQPGSHRRDILSAVLGAVGQARPHHFSRAVPPKSESFSSRSSWRTMRKP